MAPLRSSRLAGQFGLSFAAKPLRARAEINSHFAAGPQARWRGASDELYPGRYVRSEQQSQRACGPQPAGARRRKLSTEFTPKTPGRKGLPKEAENSALLASERQLRGVSGKLPIMKEGPKWANPTVCRFRLFKYPGGRERMRMR